MNLIIDGFLYTFGGIGAVVLFILVVQTVEAVREWHRVRAWSQRPFLAIWKQYVGF